jgi:oxygen-independent coproporphyrinogen-3 oxidase
MTMIVRIERKGFEDYQTELFNLLRAFHEQVEVTTDSEAQADAVLSLELVPAREREEIRGKYRYDGGEVQGAIAVQGGQDDGERRHAVRRAVLKCVLGLLREATGLEQPWGVLTGVRPTKLMHNLLMEHDKAEAERILEEEYLVTSGKVKLLSQVAERQLTVLPDLFRLDGEVSIYIGIPFCPTKCAYCTFPAYDIRGNNGSVDGFLSGLQEEIRAVGRWLREHDLGITTIYWGGGTPTSINAEQMESLFIAMHESFPRMDRVRELTVEAGRPDTITADKIEVMKRWKVDRISINPQSFTQATLDAIGRHHTVAETVEKFQLAREMGLNNINMDLIIGLPGEDVETYRRSLRETEKLLPESLTVHTLSFKRASRMTQNRDQYKVAERHEIEEMVRLTNEWTEQHGYVPYYLYRQKNILGNLENVGYALPGKESLYNIIMMEERQSVIGLGCGAVSKIVWPAGGEDEADGARRIERMPNPKEPAAYNAHYMEYIDKKLRLLDEAYGDRAVKAL